MKRTLLALLTLAACGGARPTPAPPPDHADPGHPAPPPPAPPAPKAAVGHPRNDLIPRAVLFGNPERAAIRLSPDGKQLAWLAPVNGVLNVWVAPTGKLDQAKAVTSETARPIRSYNWAYTSKHLVYAQDAGGDENFHLYRVDLPDGKTTDITPFKGARAELLEASPSQPTTLVVAMNDRKAELMDAYKVDLLTGKRTLLVQNDDNLGSYIVGDDLAVHLASRKLPDGSDELLVPVPGKKLTWKVWDTIPFADSETTSISLVSRDGKTLYGTDSRNRDKGAFVAIELATKKAKVLAEDAHADASDLLIHPTKHTVQAVAFDYDRTHWTVLDKSIQKDLDALAALDGGEVHITSRSTDDKWWTVASTSEQHPGRYYLWDRGAQKATFLFALQPALDKQPLVKMWPVVIKARDGLDLVSYLTLPASTDPDGDGKANAPVPLVLFVHGGPWARDDWGYNPVHQLLANRGYAVLSVNYRGSTGFGKAFLNAANLQWGKTMHDDLLDAVEWAIAQHIAPRDKIAIMGGSYGGYATLAGLSMTPDVFAAGVDIVGPSNLITLLASVPPYWKPLIAVFKQRMGDPDTAEGKALLLAASPLTHASAITKPLLIGQGANDPRVKQAESEQIVAAMKAKGLPVSYVLFPDEGHGFARPENNQAFFGAAEAFLSPHLGGSYQPLSADELKASTMQVKAGREGIPGLP